MKKLLIATIALTVLSAGTTKLSDNTIKQVKEYVLVCDSKNAKVYHKDYKYVSDYCSGLKNCKHQIIRVLKSDVSLTKRACKHCWK